MYPDDSLTLHTDLYQINMMQVYFEQGIHNKKAVFEVYFRKVPFSNGYAVFAFKEGFLLMCSWKYSSISSGVGSRMIPTPQNTCSPSVFGIL